MHRGRKENASSQGLEQRRMESSSVLMEFQLWKVIKVLEVGGEDGSIAR